MQLRTAIGNRSEIEPLFWLHIPKTGSSFATSIVHLACGDKIVEDVIVEEPGFGYWDFRCGSGHFLYFRSGHAPLSEGVDLSKVVMMSRAPKQRIISGYFHNLHDCGPLQGKYKLLENGSPWSVDGVVDREILMEYATCVQGCETNMLTGHECASDIRDSQSYVQEALKRLPKLGFVGLTAHWDSTVCLWHAKLGGECLPSEFKNLRVGVAREENSSYDESVYEGSFKPIDEAIHEHAEEVFVNDMVKHEVSPYSCATRFCPRMAHLFDSSGTRDFATYMRKYGIDVNAAQLSRMGSPFRGMLNQLSWPGRAAFWED